MTSARTATVTRPAELTSENQHAWLAVVLLLVFAIAAAYANSLTAPFVFDDVPGIVENPTIRHLWPLWAPLIPPGGGSSAVGRPLVNLSLAINYALGGTAVQGYHLVNILIHLAGSFALFGIARRTLRGSTLPVSVRESSVQLAGAIALLWALHPLQTESVTFVIQRTESLGSLFYLTTLYCFIRGIDPTARAPRSWLVLAVMACWAGMATKEIMVTAPLLLLLYDRTFAAGTFAAAWKARRRWYGAMAASWVLLGLLVWQSRGRGGTVGFEPGGGAWTSLLTQAQAVAIYLKLSFWPHPLIVDYGTDTVQNLSDVLPQALLLAGLLGATIFALIRHPALGFGGAWFFLILAPSSSVVPLLSQRIAEHRMYLPLAAVVTFAVLLLHRATGRAAVVGYAVLAIALGTVTAARNRDYRTAMVLWTDTVQKRPGNQRAHYNLGLELSREGDTAGAMREYLEALRLRPDYLDAHMNVAAILLAAGQLEEARPHVAAAYRLDPNSASANNNAGHERYLSGDVEGALRYFEKAVRLNPENAEAHNNLGYTLAARGDLPAAIGEFHRSLALRPDLASAYQNLGKALLLSDRAAEARASLEEAVRLRPDFAEAQLDLGNALVALEDYSEAALHFQRAVQTNPGDIRAHFNLGLALIKLHRPEEAADHLRTVLRLDPRNAAAAELLASLDPRKTATEKPRN